MIAVYETDIKAFSKGRAYIRLVSGLYRAYIGF